MPGVLRVDLEWSIGSDLTALTRLHIAYSGAAPGDATCAAIAQSLYGIFAAELCVYANAANSLLGCVVTDLTSPSSGRGSYSHTTAGSLSGGILGASTAFLASEKIARRYRGGKPRAYLPLGDSGQLLTEQLWTTGFVANVQASLDAIVADINGLTTSGTVLSTLVNVSYYEGFVSSQNPVTLRWRNIPKQRTGGAVVDGVTQWVAEQRLSSQRRRNLRSS